MAHSVATALASSVLPVPGGPYSNAPDLPSTPPELEPARAANRSGRLSGSSTTSRIAALTSSKPPTSSHVVAGTVGAPMALAVLRSDHRTASARFALVIGVPRGADKAASAASARTSRGDAPDEDAAADSRSRAETDEATTSTREASRESRESRGRGMTKARWRLGTSPATSRELPKNRAYAASPASPAFPASRASSASDPPTSPPTSPPPISAFLSRRPSRLPGPTVRVRDRGTREGSRDAPPPWAASPPPRA